MILLVRTEKEVRSQEEAYHFREYLNHKQTAIKILKTLKVLLMIEENE